MNSLISWKKFIPSLSKESHNPLLSLHQEIDKAFNQFYKEFSSDDFFNKNIQNLTIRPSFDIVEDDKTYKIEIEMPGLDEKDIEVSISDGRLHIQAKKETSRKDQGKEYIKREITYGSYEQSIDLPNYVNSGKAEASFKKGMLWISFPKTENTNRTVKKLTIDKIE